MRFFAIPLVLLTAAATTFAADQERPPADNKLPAASDIREMVIIDLRSNPKEATRVTVPASHVPKIWAKLQPAAVDKSPARWTLMGYDLELTLKNGSKFSVWVYNLPSAPGAFSAGPTFKERTYYRGGNSQQLREAITAALKEAQRDPEPKKEKPPKAAVNDPATLADDLDFAIQGSMSASASPSRWAPR